MHCSDCGKVWHVGGATCPYCGGKPVEPVEDTLLGVRFQDPGEDAAQREEQPGGQWAGAGS